MTILGTLLKNKRAGEAQLTWNLPAMAGPEVMGLHSPDFEHGSVIPKAHAGKRAGGENRSPALAWSGTPVSTAQLLLVVQDIDSPTRTPFVHCVALLEPDLVTLPTGAGQGCVLASPAFERVAQSSVTTEGRRAPALRSGDPRVMALLGVVYTPSQMSYDLGRLRLNGLIERIEGTNTYLPTPDGQRAAVFYTKIHDRLLRPLLAADTPPAPAELRAALRTIDRHVRGYIDDARLGNAA